MKTLAIHLRLETASHRKRMMGIFRQIGATPRYDIRIIPSEEALCDLLASGGDVPRPDGIISGTLHSDRAKSLVGAAGIPFVGIGMADGGIVPRPGRAGFVLNDNAGIGRAAADFFLRLGGFRSFVYVPDARGRDWSALRGAAFGAALAEAGKRCATYSADGSDARGLSDFLAALPRPIAVLAAWDGRAADVIHAAREANLRIPDEISVLGVDDDELICEHTVPTLSSIRTDSEGMGEAAARMLLGLMGGRLKGARSRVVRRPILGITQRRTTGSPAPATSLIERALSFIDAEATNGIRTDDVAKYLKVSRRLLDLRFKQFEEKSVAEKITERRVAAAARLLADTDIPIKEVFRQTGFGDVSHATKVFKKATGVSPTAWRGQKAAAQGGPAAEGAEGRDFRFERLARIEPADGTAIRKMAEALTPAAAFSLPALRASIRHGTTALYVLRRGPRLVAMATAVRFTTPTGRHCRIEDVVVDARARGKGLGRRIMEQTIRALESEGVTSIELTSRPSRVAANALYRSLGFARRRTNVYALSVSP